jgi:lysozyme
MAYYGEIIDVYEGNAPDLDDAWAQGVRVIFWETGRGLCHTDGLYNKYKKPALDKGFLWGAYHLMSGEDIDDQIAAVLKMEDGSDPRVAMGLDWEACCVPKTTLSYADMRLAIQAFNKRMKPKYQNRYPILYGGSTIRECTELVAGDTVFGSCPLWYQQYQPIVTGIPTRTWPTFAFWQYDDENRANGGPPKNILPGADWNRYSGSLDQLKAAWPFLGEPGPLVADAD